MKVLKGICIAFSIYSKIPVPQFPWKEEDMKYVLVFFPFVGAVIGGILYLWSILGQQWNLSALCRLLIGTAIPIAISGGFHLDGYMDTMDAIHSYQNKEKKLEILKDPHIGAFAVIMLVFYELIYLGALSEVQTNAAWRMICSGFVMSRILSGLSIVYFPKAKEDGSLHYFAVTANQKVTAGFLVAEMILCMLFNFWSSVKMGVAMLLLAGLAGIYYHWIMKKEFGGITGDTAGWFVTCFEVAVIIVAACIQ